MKTIKIRFYSNHLQKMVIPNDEIFVGALKDPDMNPMLFTGLKDRAGVEIFEGDILMASQRGRVVVEWINVGARFTARPVNTRFTPIALSTAAARGKVIGSIHENPELLKI